MLAARTLTLCSSARERLVEPPLNKSARNTASRSFLLNEACGPAPFTLARSRLHASRCDPFTGAGAQLSAGRGAGVALICGLARPSGRRVRVAPLRAGRNRVRFGPTQDSRQNGSLACGVWHSPLPLSVLTVTGSGGAVPPASGFGRFRHARVSGNAHKPLTSQEETHYG